MTIRYVRLAAVVLGLAGGSFLSPGATSACSCVPISLTLAAPWTDGPVSVNTQVVWIEPTYRSNGTVVVRPVSGQPVEGTSKKRTSRSVATVAFTPKVPLAANTRYEVASIDRKAHPKTLVFGTFITGTDTDSVAPKATRIEAPAVTMPTGRGGSMCGVNTPWITFPGVVKDTLYAIWVGEPGKKINRNKPSDWLIHPTYKNLVLGKSGLCDWEEASMPAKGGLYTFGVAEVDAAGNQGPLKTFRLRVPKPRKSP